MSRANSALTTSNGPGSPRPPDGVHGSEQAYCPLFQHAVEILGRRWTATILRVLGSRSLRFGEVRIEIPGLSDRLLVTRFTELEAEGIVLRTKDGTDIRYAVTEKGAALGPVLESIGAWATEWHDEELGESPGRRRC